MKEETKHDLCAEQAKIDYEALRLTAQYAVGMLKQEILVRNEKISSDWGKKKFSSMALEAKWLRDCAKKLLIATETLAVLESGVEREKKTLINIPEVQEL